MSSKITKTWKKSKKSYKILRKRLADKKLAEKKHFPQISWFSSSKMVNPRSQEPPSERRKESKQTR